MSVLSAKKTLYDVHVEIFHGIFYVDKYVGNTKLPR